VTICNASRTEGAARRARKQPKERGLNKKLVKSVLGSGVTKGGDRQRGRPAAQLPGEENQLAHHLRFPPRAPSIRLGAAKDKVIQCAHLIMIDCTQKVKLWP
jgi:hypothetical protein